MASCRYQLKPNLKLKGPPDPPELKGLKPWWKWCCWWAPCWVSGSMGSSPWSNFALISGGTNREEACDCCCAHMRLTRAHTCLHKARATGKLASAALGHLVVHNQPDVRVQLFAQDLISTLREGKLLRKFTGMKILRNK